MLELAARQQRSWSCPSAGHRGETDDPTALAVLEVIAELTGAERGCLRTCPRWHATRPEITRAVTYRRYVEAGCPGSIDENPPVALIRAAHLVAAADGDRLAAERAEQESKRGR
jgi:hypothetical protein